ncbi:unnamed protein product [Rhizoctonia solani]|uniref:Cytochrome P450 n=1 Tax=Rhizoctonia solani TaxID=456999 RepID=A0A8H3HI98_9AGAM|nr:unnamed protein product [Rhizoctonia solani]
MYHISDSAQIFSALKHGQDPISPPALFLLVGILATAGICYKVYTSWKSSTLLPPSPPKHWFWGNKYFLEQPYRHILLGTKYKQELGDIISTTTLTTTNIYLNTIELATGILDKHASVTSDRPRDVMTHEL